MTRRSRYSSLLKQLALLLFAVIAQCTLFAHNGTNSNNDKAGRKIFLCDAPTSVTISTITGSSAAVQFTSAGNDFIVEYGAPGFTPGTGAAAGAGTVVTATGSPISLNGLSNGTAYDVYIRQVCEGPEYSNNSTVVQFTTLTGAVSIPYIENFDGVSAPAVPAGIGIQNSNGGKTWKTVGTDYYVSAPNCLRLDYEEDGTTASDDWFFTPGLNLTAGNSYRLTFQYRNSDHSRWTEKLEVKYGSTATPEGMTAGTLFSNTNINYQLWREAGIDFTPPASGIYYIGFHGFSDADNAFIAIDDITVNTTPECPPPIGVTANSLTASTAIVQFSGTGDAYIVEYGPQGFTPGTGVSAGIDGTVVQATSSPVVISGLATMTDYDVYVRQVCVGPVYGPNSTVTTVQTTVANDNAPGAIAVTVGAPCADEPYTNAGATQSADEPFGFCSSATGYATVWYKFTAPAAGAVRISTATGSGTNTLTNSRLALFAATDVNDYSTFTIIACDEDGGSGQYDNMSVLYATGLTPGTEYYIQVDAFDNFTQRGTFCLSVDELNTSMLATTTGSCVAGQAPVGANSSYTGWISLMDNDSKLIALVRNEAGTRPNSFTVSQTINTDNPRIDATSGEYYLNRNFNINSAAGLANVEVQLFFLSAELSSLAAVDPAAALNSLRITRQSGSCEADFAGNSGLNFEHTQTGSDSTGGVSWVTFTTVELSNFYIHSTRSALTVKVFLQGAYNQAVSRHKNVTAAWAAVLNANALSQPYNTAAFGNYAGTEAVPNGFFKSTGAVTDILDWVLIEIKDASNVMVARRAAFVRVDGNVVDLDGISPVAFVGLAPANYHITIRHRNHLGISTQNTLTVQAKALGVEASLSGFDFTTASEADIFGTATAYKVVGGMNMMIGGNANGNNNVRYQGPANDPSSILVSLNSVTSASATNVYSGNDVNLDGIVRYQGPSNDRGWVLSNVLNSVTSTSVNEQKR